MKWFWWLLTVTACAPNMAQVRRDIFVHDRDRCTAGDGQACELAAGDADRGTGTAKDPRAVADFHRKAAAIYRKHCSAGGPHDGCAALGRLGVLLDKSDPETARAAMVDACNAGDLDSCNNEAMAYELGTHGLAVDKKHAAALRARVCLEGNHATEATPSTELYAIASACSRLAIDLQGERTSAAARLGAIKLDIVAGELRMEASESAWMEQDKAALASHHRAEALAEANRLAAEEAASRHSMWGAALEGLVSGWQSMQPLLEQQRQLSQMNATVMAQARAQIAQSHQRVHYTPPPRPPALATTAGVSMSTTLSSSASAGAGVQQDHHAQREQCIAQKVTQMHVTQTSPFVSLTQTYGGLVARAKNCAEKDWPRCMDGAIWREDERHSAVNSFLDRRTAVLQYLAPGTATCTPFDTDLHQYCHTMSKDNCVESLDYAARMLRTCGEAAFPIFTAEDARNNADAQRRHDDECGRRFP
jgi:hypothetical protein